MATNMPDGAVLTRQLEQGITELGQDPGGLPLDQLVAYLELLHRWNQAYNLTAVRDPGDMVAYHVLDSLSLLPYLENAPGTVTRGLDMGTGAGLPGLVLALARPDMHWVLLDSNAKKTRFLQQVRLQLEITNIEIVRQRITEYSPDMLFNVITARALSGLDNLCGWAQPLLAPGGRLLAMKAAPDADELDSVAGRSLDYRSHELRIPGLEGPRSLLELWFDT